MNVYLRELSIAVMCICGALCCLWQACCSIRACLQPFCNGGPPSNHIRYCTDLPYNHRCGCQNITIRPITDRPGNRTIVTPFPTGPSTTGEPDGSGSGDREASGMDWLPAGETDMELDDFPRAPGRRSATPEENRAHDRQVARLSRRFRSLTVVEVSRKRSRSE